MPVGEPDAAADIQGVQLRRIAEVHPGEPYEFLSLRSREELVRGAGERDGSIEFVSVLVSILVVVGMVHVRAPSGVPDAS